MIIQPGDGDPRHGTANGYCNLKCGTQPDGPRRACKPCKDAWADVHLKYMHSHPEQYTRHAAYEAGRRAARKAKYGVPYEQLQRP